MPRLKSLSLIEAIGCREEAKMRKLSAILSGLDYHWENDTLTAI
jgi:hypothetical protein